VKQLLIATGNMHKVHEISEILDDLAFDWRTTRDWPDAEEPVEDGDTYEANSLIKAQAWCERTGLPTLADDSGLEVRALDGRPGLYSSRYAGDGEDACLKLLGELSETPEEERDAQFVCVATLYFPDGRHVSTRGILQGRIGTMKRGEKGFGFDPVFIPGGYDRHLAEIGGAHKNEISHRARALRELRPQLEALLRGEG
jgi:XTP/dITP diphosphohydrolase